ncbi:MAG: fluoride efflux transporter CrcB [Bacteroides sp.]|nr:fluoride efflux transporter CrcB [Bacteroides sp.]
MKALICVFLGGGAGSLLRYSVQLLTTRAYSGHFPWSTFTVNILGSLLIGMFYVLSEKFSLSQEVRLLLTVGFCGGFTTFSTFSADGLMLLRSGAYSSFFLYAVGSVILGIIAALAGMWLAK